MQQKKTTQEEYQKCVNAVVDYINLHLGEEIDLKSLARISHFSPFYFHRIMKAFLGEPVGTFIVRTRTEAAARLLRYSDMPIADIAYASDIHPLLLCRKCSDSFMVFLL